MSRFKLPRRTVLRGAAGGVGAALALPLLEAMVDENGEALADGAPLPVRFLTWFFGNGVRLDKFVPAAAYPNPWALSEELQPLAPVKDYVSVLTGFNNRTMYNITHHEGNTVFSGYDILNIGGDPTKPFSSFAGGPTVDQVIADIIAADTPIKSVQLGVSRKQSEVDGGTTVANLSHGGVNNPLPPEYNPQAVWQSIFNSFVPPDDPRKALRARVVDLVRGKATALRQRLGTLDRQRLDAHLDGVNELQKKIEALPPACTFPDQPTEANAPVGLNDPEPLANVTAIMHDLIVEAFKCDITRVASLMFVQAAAHTIYHDLGHTSEFHNDYTHNQSQAIQDTEVHAGVVYTMERFADLLVKLQNTEDGVHGGTLLDSSAIFCSTDCAEGYTHSVQGQPMIIAGGANGKLVHPGIHYASQSGENPTDALLALVQCFDDTVTQVGGFGQNSDGFDDNCGSSTPLDVIKA